MRKPSKQRAIRDFCFECCGESPKEVTLCADFKCPLWPFRTGYWTGSPVYRKRMEMAKKNYAEDLAEMAAEGVDVSFFDAPSRPVEQGASQNPRTEVAKTTDTADGETGESRS